MAKEGEHIKKMVEIEKRKRPGILDLAKTLERPRLPKEELEKITLEAEKRAPTVQLEKPKKIFSLRGILREILSKKPEFGPKLPKFYVSGPKHILSIPKIEDMTKVDIRYSLIEPFAYARIRYYEQRNELVYELDEPNLTDYEKNLYDKIIKTLTEIVDVQLSSVKNPEEAIIYVEEQVKKILVAFSISINPEDYIKIMYYIYRNFIGLNEIEPLMRDPLIEDIGLDGLDVPIYIVHRKFGSIKTNIIFSDSEYLKDFVVKLSERCGRYISYAEPLLDGSLPGGSRVQASLAADVTTRGPTFSIRKFIEKPLSPIDILDLGTASAELLAYLWLAVESGACILVCGGTATGKSVTGDTMVFTSHCGVEEIGKLYEEFKSKYGERKLDEVYTIVEIPEEFGFSVPSLNKEGQVEIKPVSAIWKKKSYPEIFELKLENGTLVRTTPEHPFFIFDGQEIKKVRTDELKEGCYIVSSNRINPFNKNRIDILSELKKRPEIVKHRFLIEVDELTKKKFMDSFVSKFKYWKKLREFHYSEESIKKLLKNNFIPYELLEKTNIYPENINRVGWLKSSVSVGIPKLDYGFGRLLGLICGDGTLEIRNGGKNSSLEITNEKEDMRKEFIQLIKNSFGIDEITATVKASNRVAISLRSVIRFFSEIINMPANDKVSKWAVPNVVAKGNREVISGFISGLIDTDGSVGMDGIEITTKSDIAAKQLPYLFHLFGAMVNVSEKIVKNQKYYRIRVRDLTELTKYVKTNYKKILVSNVSVYAPVNGSKLKEILIKIYGNVKKLPNYEVLRTYWSTSASKKRRPSIKSLRSIIELIQNQSKFINLSDEEKQMVKNWKLLADKKIILSRIEKLNKIKSKEKWLYDFSVEGTHNFLAGNFGCCFISNTTFLNVLSMFIPVESRIISIEDTRELALPHENWIPSVARRGFGIPTAEGRYGEVTMFDLLKESFRQNPDYVIVGEVRGAEAYVLFQGMASGHSSFGTMHAGRVEDLIHRLETPPIELPSSLIETLDMVIMMVHARERGKAARRVREIVEIESVDPKTGAARTNKIFSWLPTTDSFEYRGYSWLMQKISKLKGVSLDELQRELIRRKKVLEWMHKEGIKDYKQVAETFAEYKRRSPKLLKAAGVK